MSTTPSVYDVFTATDYTVTEDNKEVKKTRYTNVGVAFPEKNGDGMNVELPENIAVSGRFYIRARKPRDQS